MGVLGRLESGVFWAIVSLWGILSIIATELFWHAVYGSALDWLKERFAEQTAQVIARLSAHTLPAAASAVVCILIYLLGAYRHSEGENRHVTAQPAAPAAEKNAARPLSQDQREQAIRLKADIEYSQGLVEFFSLPLPRKLLDDNIERDYAPHSVLYRSVNIRRNNLFQPTIEQLIASELETHKQQKIPFDDLRISEIRNKLLPLIDEVSRAMVLGGYYDAERHVYRCLGFVNESKLKELETIRDELLITLPVELQKTVDLKLDSAKAESLLAL